MKKIITIAVLFFSVLGSAQSDPSTYPVATVTTDYCVQLDTNVPLAEFYKIDITPFGFTTFAEAHDQFGRISNNLLTYKVDIDNQRVVLQVHLDRTDVPHDLAWWNDYLDSLCGL